MNVWVEINAGGVHKLSKAGDALATFQNSVQPVEFTYQLYKDNGEVCIAAGMLLENIPLTVFKEHVTILAQALDQDCIPVYVPSTGEGWLVGRHVTPWQPFRLEKFQRAPHPDQCEDV